MEGNFECLLVSEEIVGDLEADCDWSVLVESYLKPFVVTPEKNTYHEQDNIP